ncbi:hypothetical protein O181_000820 [Austropuccinia psidii MF-1]|uniref:Uncharacterized protein n=1 Tax=Austropuccinia psidii MF-1 TaxID=1389203 RepID=A0A9Q3B9K6_9BASI|nr:hypothetical protein [Austropuccinia psidii MF-1]
MAHPHSVPIVPNTSMLKDFRNSFKSPEEIKKMAESDTSIPLIPQILANSFKASFLPNAPQSIPGILHPEKDLSDHKFTEKYWENCISSYELSHKISKEDDESARIENFSESDEEIEVEKNEEESNQA